MMSAVDKQGAEASPKFSVLLTASLVLVPHNIRVELRSGLVPPIRRRLGPPSADVQWMISAYVFIIISKR